MNFSDQNQKHQQKFDIVIKIRFNKIITEIIQEN